MVDLDLFDPSDPVQVDCLRFCFTQFLREEVTELATMWNQHIRLRHRNGRPTGRPGIMFSLLQTYDTIGHLQHVSNEDLDDSKVS